MAASKPASNTGGFAGFGPNALNFFEQLADNQNREWFEAHRATYEREVREPLAALVEALAFAFAAQDIKLTGNPKASLFRINRDMRFSKDKTPYKTNAYAVLSRDGTKQGVGILYVQIGGSEPAFVAMGFYNPEPEDLFALRKAIVTSPQSWVKTQTALRKGGLELSPEHTLARLPKGFEAQAGSTQADILRLKSFVVRRPLRMQSLFGTGMVDEIVSFARSGEALLSFGRNAIDRGRAERG